jgi:hypothetical protein
MVSWFKRVVLDGWITEGPQIATPPGLLKMFCRCHGCSRVWPHWWSELTAEEFKAQKRRTLGCPCGSLKLAPCYLPTWQSVWWFCLRGWLWRKVIRQQRVWDPRMPVMMTDVP